MAIKEEKVHAQKLDGDKLDPDKPFKEHWSSTIFPFLRPDYERLVKATPTRIKDKHQNAQP